VDDPKAWEKVMGGPEAERGLSEALGVLRELEGFDADTIEAALTATVERLGLKPKAVYQPIRVAITGSTVSPGIFESLAVLGRERSIQRIETALARLRG
jgi:glutamyl-tRNA synthetase